MHIHCSANRTFGSPKVLYSQSIHSLLHPHLFITLSLPILTMTRLKHLSPLPGPTTTETAALSDEQYYTIQPTPNGMPRSVRELREGIGLLSNDQLRQLVVAEAKRNNAFAGEVFENCDQEIFMRLNTIFDFDHFTERLEADIVVCQMSHSEDEQRLDAQKLVEQVDEVRQAYVRG